MGNEKLVGTWILEAASSTSSTGERDEVPYGPKPSGVLTYGADGIVTVLISYGGRKVLSLAPSAAEEAEAFKTFFAYSGRYTLEGDQIVHRVEISSIQNYVSRELRRTIKFDGDRIVLITPPTPMNGTIRTVELIWKRMEVSAR